jgi:hypothetical protein
VALVVAPQNSGASPSTGRHTGACHGSGGVSDISYRLPDVYAVVADRTVNVSREWHFIDTNCERVDSIEMVVLRQSIEVRTRMEWFLVDSLRFQRAERLQLPEDCRCRPAFGNA